MKDQPAKNVAIQMNGVNKWFGAFHVLKDIDLTVGVGGKGVICGPSGAGKSTIASWLYQKGHTLLCDDCLALESACGKISVVPSYAGARLWDDSPALSQPHVATLSQVADYSEKLRRGDAYVRINENVMKMGRRQLSELFEKKFRDSVSADDLEIGFAGEIIHKDLTLSCCDLSQLPSSEASNKLNQLIDIQNNSRQSGSTTVMARLTHARLFGTDDAPKVDRLGGIFDLQPFVPTAADAAALPATNAGSLARTLLDARAAYPRR